MPPLLHRVYVCLDKNHSSHHVYDIRDFIIRVCFSHPLLPSQSVEPAESGRIAKHYTQWLHPVALHSGFAKQGLRPFRNPVIGIKGAELNSAPRNVATRKPRECPKYSRDLRTQVGKNRMKSLKSLL